MKYEIEIKRRGNYFIATDVCGMPQDLGVKIYGKIEGDKFIIKKVKYIRP